MARLDDLLADRERTIQRGFENRRKGRVYFYQHQNLNGASNSCAFCWIAPGNGVAVVELWGASGSGQAGCCCSGPTGLPGNPGAYSRKTVTVSSGSNICGLLGCNALGSCFCLCCFQSQCSVACFCNTSENTTMFTAGGLSGYSTCMTGNNAFCCIVFRSARCNTPAGTGCGIICNVNSTLTAACACGGDVNISGGVSCMEFLGCCNSSICANILITLAIAPGIYSSSGNTCVQFRYGLLGQNTYAFSGHRIMDHVMAGLRGRAPQQFNCATSSNDCACYDITGCQEAGVGIPGTSGWVCANTRAAGRRGGMGGVKITFYSD